MYAILKNIFFYSISDFTIVKCGLKCREKSHFHCCYCSVSVLTRANLLNHIASQHSPSTHPHPQSSAVLQTKPESSSVQDSQPQSSSTQQTQPQVTSVKQEQPQSSAQQTQPQVTSVKQEQPQSPSVHQLQSLPKLSAKKTATCSQCNVTLLAKNLRPHIQRRHTDRVNAMTPEKHLRSQCIDEKIGIFAVEKAFHGQAIPIHVIKNTWGPNFRSACELDQCISNAEYAHITGILPFECCHVQSLCFCKQVEESNFALTENSLSQLVQEKWFGEARKIQLLKLQQEANIAETPLSFHVTVGSSSTKCFISVFEPTVSYYSRMGRVMVAYDKKKNNWHCPCAKPRQSCIHKATAKWHLFQTKKGLRVQKFPTLFMKMMMPPVMIHIPPTLLQSKK